MLSPKRYSAQDVKRWKTTRSFSPPEFSPICTLGGIGIAAQLYLLCDSQVPRLGWVFMVELFSLVGRHSLVRGTWAFEYFSTLVQEGGAPEVPSGVGNQGRDNAAAGA
jgi:hypothetical protein